MEEGPYLHVPLSLSLCVHGVWCVHERPYLYVPLSLSPCVHGAWQVEEGPYLHVPFFWPVCNRTALNNHLIKVRSLKRGIHDLCMVEPSLKDSLSKGSLDLFQETPSIVPTPYQLTSELSRLPKYKGVVSSCKSHEIYIISTMHCHIFTAEWTCVEVPLQSGLLGYLCGTCTVYSVCVLAVTDTGLFSGCQGVQRSC